VPGLPRLYLITDRALAPGGDLAAALAAPLVAGVRLVQLRAKDLSARDLLALARAVKARTDAAGASLLINDRADVAVAVGAAGVHLTSDDPPVAEVRAWLGSAALIGVSTHTPAEAAAAGREGASFVTFGTVYDTPSKRGLGTPVGTAALAEAVRSAGVPVFALGGVDAARLAEVRGAGAHGIAVIRAVLADPDPGGAARGLLAALARWKEGGQSR
jgi:thiamine-phosphate pyrophosphorylase